MMEKGRQAPPDQKACQGDKNGRAKLTEADVLAIRARYRFRVVTMIALAREFGVNPATINDILHGRAWPHLL
jgi:hypothetical protein